MASPVYIEFAQKMRKLFGKEIVKTSELKSQKVILPQWVYGYCLIGKNEYYFGEDRDCFEAYREYSNEDFEKFREKVIELYDTEIITVRQLLAMREHGIKVPTWARRRRYIEKGIISFEREYTPWCPLFDDEKEDAMQLTTTSGSSLATNKQEPVNDTPEIVETHDNFNFDDLAPVQAKEEEQPTQLVEHAVPAVDMTQMASMMKGFAHEFANAFHRKEPVTSVPPRPKDFYVPKVDSLYIKWGIYKDIELILDRNMFYPCFITGLSGNGKTLGIEQACANAGKELVLVNITQETDEDDLLGGYRLIDGNTVWQDGPVVIAMKRGCPLLLDEIDYGSSKLSCLQSVLSGKAVLLKKTGEIVHPQPGFTVFATANTKGQGDTTGKFAGTNIMNEAFLDRFPITLHNPYPSRSVEEKIFETALTHFRFVYDGGKEPSKDDLNFISRLVHWCAIIRKTHEQEAIDEVISTRRGVDILKSYVIFGSRERAIAVGCERFNEDTRLSLAKLYSAVDEQIEIERKAKESKPSAKEASRNGRAAVASATASKESEDDLGTEWGEVNSALAQAIETLA